MTSQILLAYGSNSYSCIFTGIVKFTGRLEEILGQIQRFI